MRLKARVTCLFSGSDASIASETSWFVTSKYLYSRIDLWRLDFYVDIVPVAALCNFLHFPVPISPIRMLSRHLSLNHLHEVLSNA
jgi:hypothetical protein